MTGDRDNVLTTEQAYEAAFRFVVQYWARESDSKSLALLAVAMEPTADALRTNDPASWSDWEQCVQETKAGASIPTLAEEEDPMLVKPALDEARNVALTGRDLMMLGAGLTAYLKAFEEHRVLDGGLSHPDDQWQELRRQVGELIWRLEAAGAGPNARVVHSAEAVDPDSGRQ